MLPCSRHANGSQAEGIADARAQLLPWGPGFQVRLAAPQINQEGGGEGEREEACWRNGSGPRRRARQAASARALPLPGQTKPRNERDPRVRVGYVQPCCCVSPATTAAAAVTVRPTRDAASPRLNLRRPRPHHVQHACGKSAGVLVTQRHTCCTWKQRTQERSQPPPAARRNPRPPARPRQTPDLSSGRKQQTAQTPSCAKSEPNPPHPLPPRTRCVPKTLGHVT